MNSRCSAGLGWLHKALAELTHAEKELVWLQNLMCTRVAKILEALTKLGVPWIFQSTATSGKQASVLHLDEFKQLTSLKGVKQLRGVQCPYGALSASPLTMVFFLVDLEDMPDECRHELQVWYSQKNNTATMASHAPHSADDSFSSTQTTKSQMKVCSQ